MNFPNVQILNANSRSDFFGENLRWKTVLEITVEGIFLDLSSTTYNAIHTQLNNLENTIFASSSNFYQPITINGVSFGSGYITNFTSGPEGDDVNDKRYSVNIVIPQDGSINTSIEGLNGSISDSNFKFLESFSESSTFTKGEGIKDSYSQTISLTLIPPVKNQANNRLVAKNIIEKFINNNSLTSLITGQYQKSVKKYYEQAYDPITNTYSFNVSYDLYPRESQSSDNVLVTRNTSISYQQDGIIIATENVECVSNIAGTVNARYNAAYTRALQLLNSSLSNLSNSYNVSKYGNLIPTPITKNFTSVVFEGRVSYSISYTTSRELIAQEGFWEYSINIEKNESGEITGSEDGTIIGVSEVNISNTKYQKALALYNSKKSQIKNRITNYVSGAFLKEVSSSETHSEIQGSIKYNRSYNSSNAIQETGPFTKIVSNIQEDYDRKLFSTFNIVGKKEIAQIQKNLLENNITYNIVLNGRANVSFSEYLSKARSLISNIGFISNVSYSYSPSEREFNFSATYFIMP